MRLSVDEFAKMTFRQFSNALKGYRRKNDAESKERLIIMRKIAYCSALSVLKKGISEQQFMPFDWEKNIVDNINNQDKEEILKQLEDSKSFWENYDKQKEKNIKC